MSLLKLVMCCGRGVLNLTTPYNTTFTKHSFDLSTAYMQTLIRRPVWASKCKYVELYYTTPQTVDAMF